VENNEFLSKGGEDEVVENILRPRNLEEYIGQEKIKEGLRVFIKAAQKRKEPLEHILIYGPPGLGKTTLAHVMANETGSRIIVTSGPAIERSGDLVSILTNLNDSDVLFIDEIHRLNKVVEEVLYPAMEDYAVDVVIGKGPSAKTLRVDLPRFTLIGATTRVSMLSSPLRDRFGLVQNLDFYNEGEIEKILKRSAKILKIDFEGDSLGGLAARSRKTPRVANRLLKRVRDFATVYNKGKINKGISDRALRELGVDEMGFDDIDRKYLAALTKSFGGGPAGIETLSAATSIDRDTIEEVIEPYLMQTGFIRRTPRGRMATDRAFEFFDIEKQQRLI
jgi:Holliday junction DNA helicase RuvB